MTHSLWGGLSRHCERAPGWFNSKPGKLLIRSAKFSNSVFTHQLRILRWLGENHSTTNQNHSTTIQNHSTIIQDHSTTTQHHSATTRLGWTTLSCAIILPLKSCLPLKKNPIIHPLKSCSIILPAEKLVSNPSAEKLVNNPSPEKLVNAPSAVMSHPSERIMTFEGPTLKKGWSICTQAFDKGSLWNSTSVST